jgi:hypothetical protein
MKREYKKCIDIVIKLNELMVQDASDKKMDPLYDQLAKYKKKLDEEQALVIERLTRSFVSLTTVEIDEATPGAKAHWGS